VQKWPLAANACPLGSFLEQFLRFSPEVPLLAAESGSTAFAYLAITNTEQGSQTRRYSR
jgi:hypothetical protein